MQLVGFTAKWVDGSHHKTDANVAYKVTSELEERGELTAKNLVNVSRPEEAPLHPEFEWDDIVAAEKYRESQARYIIRSIQIVREDYGKEEKAFVNLRVECPEYTSVRKALAIPDERDLLMKAARREMMAFVAKYGRMEELDTVVNSINLFLGATEDEPKEAAAENSHSEAV